MSIDKETKFLIEVFKEGASINHYNNKNIEILKKNLRDNGYKICGMGVSMMIDEMIGMGMSQDCATYWKTLGMTNFPYEPSKALKK